MLTPIFCLLALRTGSANQDEQNKVKGRPATLFIQKQRNKNTPVSLPLVMTFGIQLGCKQSVRECIISITRKPGKDISVTDEIKFKTFISVFSHTWLNQ